MILSMRILGCPCLATDSIVGEVCLATSSPCHCHAHALSNHLEILRSDPGLHTLDVERVLRHTIDLLHQVWGIVVPSIGNDSSEVGNLHGRSEDLALSYRDGDYRAGGPATIVDLVIDLRVWDIATAFSGQVHSGLVSKAHLDNIVSPVIKSFFHGGIARSVVQECS